MHLALLTALAAPHAQATAQNAPRIAAARPAVAVDGSIALAALVSLADAHLEAVVHEAQTVADTPAAASGDWNAVRPELANVAKRNLAGVYFYARADGTYWTVEKGLQTANLSDRPYFASALHGTTVVGALVTSRSTGKEVAVVAVPVRGPSGAVTGIIGASIYLDAFSALLSREIALSKGYIFFAIDRGGTIVLHADPTNIFLRPGQASAEMAGIMTRLLGPTDRPQTYAYRGVTRTMLLRDSPLTGWRFGFGVEH